MEKIFVPFALTKRWKAIRGLGSRYRRNRYKSLAKEQLGVKSDEAFYTIMNARQAINEHDVVILERLLKAV